MLPPTTRTGGSGTNRITESAVRLLPQPLSPTTPSVPPGGMENDTTPTARTGPASSSSRVLSPRTSRRGSGMDEALLARQLLEEFLLADEALADEQADEAGHHSSRLHPLPPPLPPPPPPPS